VDFVYGTLFPFARERARRFLEETWADGDTRADVAALGQERAKETGEPPGWREEPASVASYVLWLMDQDRKSTSLKSLQGRIWEDGYERGELRGLVYDDVPRALERWRRQGSRIAIFSSGSVLAQRLLFAHSSAGDLSGFIDGYFDTTIGPKREAGSYRKIAAALGLAAGDVLFVSDVGAESDAAAEAGMATALALRGDAPSPSTAHRIVRSFDEL